MKSPLTALAIFAAGVLTLRAQTPVTATFSDLVIGFRATNSANGAGTDKNLELNLGNAGQFYNLTPNSRVSLGSLGGDLAAVYDLIWNARDDLYWGVIGTTGAASGTSFTSGGTTYTIASKTLWGGKAESVAGVQTTAWNRGTTFAQQGPAGTIAGLYTSFPGSLNGKVSTANNASAVVVDNTQTGSWTVQIGGTAAAFGYFNPKSSFEASANFGTIVGSFSVLDLYEMQPGSGAGTYLGSFALDVAGQLFFSNNAAEFAVSAVPEPAHFAACFGAAGLGLAWARRRKMIACAGV
jgi:hypothetical protein